MRAALGPAAILLAAWASALLGGFFFAFSNTVMPGLGLLPGTNGAATMNSINDAVQNGPFFALFFGMPLLGAVLGAAALFRPRAPGSALLLFAGALLVLGMFGVTVVVNVPMNDALGALDLSSTSAPAAWADYLSRWTEWNHLRTACCAAASLAYLLAAHRLRGG